MEKSKHLQEQLKELKSEIEVLKVEDKETYMDVIHAEKQANGETKYTTLRKVSHLIFLLFTFFSLFSCKQDQLHPWINGQLNITLMSVILAL